MKIKVILKSIGIEDFPLHPNYFLNCAIYNFMTISNKKLADYIHNQGYECEKKRYKPFCFSQPKFEHYKVAKDNNIKKIFVAGKVEWIISSPFDDIITAIIEGMAHEKRLKIQNAEFQVLNFESIHEPIYRSGDIFYSDSPIVVPLGNANINSTRNTFLSPVDPRFTEQLADNAYRKLKILTGKEYNFRFEMYDTEKYTPLKCKRFTQYRTHPRIGYLLPVKIFAKAEAIKKLVDFGIGAYNCQGFGMISKKLN